MLRYWLRQPDFDAFRACLPILGEDGSLTDVAVRSPARGLVYAKTGTLVGDDLPTDRVACAGQGTRRILLQPVLDANENVGEIAALLWQDAHNS
jgi:hypothetical protein